MVTGDHVGWDVVRSSERVELLENVLMNSPDPGAVFGLLRPVLSAVGSAPGLDEDKGGAKVRLVGGVLKLMVDRGISDMEPFVDGAQSVAEKGVATLADTTSDGGAEKPNDEFHRMLF